MLLSLARAKERRSGLVSAKHRQERMMEKAAFKWAIIASAVIGFGACALAQDIDVGKIEYQSSCAACHGADGKGKGPFGAALKSAPTDLTVLSKKNNGVFPVNAVYEVVDGRTAIGSHGTREMPIWGYRYRPPEAYKLKQADDYVYSPPASPEGVVHGRILAVIDYLNRIQEK